LDKDQNKNFLIEYIDNLAKEKKITKHPIIILDGEQYRYDGELKKNKLPILKNDIIKIDLLKNEAAQKVFGESAKNGVLLITTKSSQKNNDN
jgi:hypothetical protein